MITVGKARRAANESRQWGEGLITSSRRESLEEFIRGIDELSNQVPAGSYDKDLYQSGLISDHYYVVVQKGRPL